MGWLLAPVFVVFGCTTAPPATLTRARSPVSGVGPPAAPITVKEPVTAPPPVVTEPMPGEPEAALLGQARLVESSCEDPGELARRTDALVKQMRAEVDATFQNWRASQQGCWQRYRLMSKNVSVRMGATSASGAGYGYGAVGVGLSGRASALKDSSTAAAPAAKRASGTNNQVAGVDEADIVKNDGRYVYLAMNGALRIVQALEPRLLSVTKLPGMVRELFVEGDRAVVYVSMGGNARQRCTYGYDCQFAGDGSSTKIVVLDIANRSIPRISRELELSGSLMAARRIGRTVHTVVSDGDAAPPPYSTWPSNLDACGVRESAARARFAQLKLDNERRIRASIQSALPTIKDKGTESQLCDHMLRTPMGDGKAFTTLVSFELDNNAPATTFTIQSRPGAVYASADALYLAVVHRKTDAKSWYSFYDSADELSDVHKFRIGSDPRETRYQGSGVVPGHVLNQFAMDQWYGYLRIATTRGRVPDPKVESAVSVLATDPDGNLVRVGAVEGIAPREDIRAVRFDDDRGYVVTFKKTDPLFVLDLHSPAHPVILGELKIPGFSTYMHRIDKNHLLSIGFDANDHGDFAFFDGVILQLFDVSRPTDPRLLHKEKIGTRGSSSEAATNHLAFNYFAERGLLAIPMTICEGGGDGVNGGELAFSGLLVYNVSPERGFTRLGGINHGTRGANCNTWWSNANSAVKRSIFLDELVYSIATDRLKVQRMDHFGKDVAEISLVP
jgi:hypothetical protein